MVFPKCKSEHTGVVDSRPYKNQVNRRRWCPNCDHRFSTVEISKDEYKEIMEHLYALQRIKPKLVSLAEEIVW